MRSSQCTSQSKSQSTSQHAAQRQQLRQQLLQRRDALSDSAKQHAAKQLAEHCLQLPEVQQARAIGLYKSVRGELGTQALLNALLAQQKQLAVPVLHPFTAGNLLMLSYNANTQWVNNKFGIPEPRLRCPDVVPLEQLDLLLIPLVGFDRHGNRLGMGGGFYDRTLARWHHGELPNLQVFGLAHDCQQVDPLPAASWDVPLNGVITPSQLWRF